MYKLSVMLKLFGFVLIILGVSGPIVQAQDDAYLIKITQKSSKNHIEIFAPQERQKSIYQRSFSHGNWSLKQLDSGTFGSLAKLLQSLSFNSGRLTVKGFGKQSANDAIRIETSGPVTLDNLFVSRFNLLADSAVTNGITTIQATDEFQVNSFTQDGTLSLGNGNYHVLGLYKIQQGSTFKHLDKMHLFFGDFQNDSGEIDAHNLTVNLKSSIKLGKVKANTLTFNLEDTVDPKDLASRNKELQFNKLINNLIVNGSQYLSLLDYANHFQLKELESRTQKDSSSQIEPSSFNTQGKYGAPDLDDYVIEFFYKGHTIHYNGRSLNFIGPVKAYFNNYTRTPEQINYDGLIIDRTLPLSQVLQKLQIAGGVSNATLKCIPPSVDKLFQREFLEKDGHWKDELPVDEKIQITRDILEITLKYCNLKSTKAKNFLPIAQHQLAFLLLLKSQKNTQLSQKLIFLKESMELLEHSIESGDCRIRRDYVATLGEYGTTIFTLGKTLKEREKAFVYFEKAIEHDVFSDIREVISNIYHVHGTQWYNEGKTIADKIKGIEYIKKAEEFGCPLASETLKNVKEGLAIICSFSSGSFQLGINAQRKNDSEDAKRVIAALTNLLNENYSTDDKVKIAKITLEISY